MATTQRGVRPKIVARRYERIKVVSMGEAGVGKSCLIKRYCEQKFVERYIATIGVDFGVKSVQVLGQEVKVNFWDLSGHQEFVDIRNEFYKDTQAVMLVFDVTNRKSFLELDKWLREAHKHGAKDFLTVVCANKVDLGERAVSETEARAWANSRNFKYLETSCKNGKNITELFEYIFETTIKMTSKAKKVNI